MINFQRISRRFATASSSNKPSALRAFIQSQQKALTGKAVSKIASSSSQNPSLSSAQPRWTRTQWRREIFLWGSVFVAFFSWASWYGRSIQLKNSPLFKGVMFTLRQNEQVKQWIGDSIRPSSIISGYINHIKGRAEISFDILGSSGKGSVKLKARRNIASENSVEREVWFVESLECEIAGEPILSLNSPLLFASSSSSSSSSSAPN